MGALTFAFIDPVEAKYWVDEYYETFKNECTPIGRVVNPNIAMPLHLSPLMPFQLATIERWIAEGANCN